MSERRPALRTSPTFGLARAWLICEAAALLVFVPLLTLGGEDVAKDAGAKTRSAKEALSHFNPLIGAWRGTGQPRRGSAVGSWLEKGEWVWDFTQPTPAIRYDVTGGKILKSLRLNPEAKPGMFRAVATLADGSTR